MQAAAETLSRINMLAIVATLQRNLCRTVPTS
jgi:hypothetical protein